MKLFASTLLAVAALGVTVPAYAAGQTDANWTGPYIGAQLGYEDGRTQDKANPSADRKDISGVIAGGLVGYNYQLDNNLVLGAEADVTFGKLKNNWDGGNQFDPYSTEDKIKAFGTVRARAGYAMGGVMPYVTGGLLWINSDHSLSCRKADAPGGTNGCRVAEFSNSASSTKVGWTVGAGVEYQALDNWTFRAEYLYGKVGKDDVTLPDPNYPAAISNRKFDTNLNVLRAAVSYKF